MDFVTKLILKETFKICQLKQKYLNKKLLYKTFIKNDARKVLFSKSYVKKTEQINIEQFWKATPQ